MREASSSEFTDASQRRGSRAGQRIEHPHLDVGLEGQSHHERIATGAVEIVEQYAHTHAAPRRLAHAPEQAGACWRRRGSRSTGGPASSARPLPARVCCRRRPGARRAAESRSRSGSRQPPGVASRARQRRCRSATPVPSRPAAERLAATPRRRTGRRPRRMRRKSAGPSRQIVGALRMKACGAGKPRRRMLSAAPGLPRVRQERRYPWPNAPSSSQRSSAASNSSSMRAWRSPSSAARDASLA